MRQLESRTLGPGAPDVSIIGYGCMPLSTEGRPEDESESIRVVHSVLDAGVTLLDSSNTYCLDDNDIGHNEKLIAKALKSWSGDRDSIVVATKGGRTRPQGRWEADGRPEKLKQACEQSLRDLDVDRIDLYQLNIPDPNVPFEESVGALADLQREGKIRWIGLSNVSVDEIDRASSMIEVVTVQNRLNPIFREEIEGGVVKYCGDRGIGFLAYHPVGGWLSQDLGRHRTLRRIARRRRVTPHAVAIAWVIAQGPTVIPIPASRRTYHALDSISAADVTLNDDELAEIDRATFSKEYSFRRRARAFAGRTVRRVISLSF